MASSPPSSDLSSPPSAASSPSDDGISTAVPSSRPSVDITPVDPEPPTGPPAKKRRTGPSTLSNFHRAPSSQPPANDADDTAADDVDDADLSTDGFSSAPGSPDHNEYALRDEAQVECLWRDCSFGLARDNDELVKHVQATHCATGGVKKTKYVCEWGECQRKTSNHPSGYALKAHMRSHTKEKPYYCALPECDKAFTRSDALAKHMRTVHEPEPARPAANTPKDSSQPDPASKSGIRLKLANGSATVTTPKPSAPVPEPPSQDEDGNPITPSAANDNIAYTPAHHPLTGQPGFMITYPPDIHFTGYESSLPANHLLRLLRRQLNWAQKEGDQLAAEIESLEKRRWEEWVAKETLLDGVMEEELARGKREDYVSNGAFALEQDILPAQKLQWTHGEPAFRNLNNYNRSEGEPMDIEPTTPPNHERTPSPPPTGHSGGFDGDADPYDNYLAGRMAEYEERERLRSAHATPVQLRKEKDAEAEAVGALVGLSEGGG